MVQVDGQVVARTNFCPKWIMNYNSFKWFPIVTEYLMWQAVWGAKYTWSINSGSYKLGKSNIKPVNIKQLEIAKNAKGKERVVESERIKEKNFDEDYDHERKLWELKTGAILAKDWKSRAFHIYHQCKGLKAREEW